MRVLTMLLFIVIFVPLAPSAEATPPAMPSLESAISACENKGYSGGAVLDYYGRGQISAERTQQLLTLGCNGDALFARRYLGTYYLNTGDRDRAWYPLATACFVNDNVACHTLREEQLILPPYMSPRSNWGPSWPKDFTPDVDLPFIEHQREFRSCYEKRAQPAGFMEFQIEIIGGIPQVRKLRAELPPDLVDCFKEEIGHLRFRENLNLMVERSFTYSTIYTLGR